MLARRRLSVTMSECESLNAVEQQQQFMQLEHVNDPKICYKTALSRISSQNLLSEEDSSEIASADRTTADDSPRNGTTGDTCRVCGDVQAKMHYGVLACFGCKGFFRRALKRANQYECNNNGKCVIDKFERNSCRYCRLRRCLEVGMDPAAVRPDRDFTGPQHAIRLPVVKRPVKEELRGSGLSTESSEWSKRLPVEMRTVLMNLLNIEAKVTKGDTKKKAEEVYPLPEHTLRELIEDPSKLKGLRTEMRYEPYRMAANSELLLIAYRRLIAAVDWVTFLSEMMNGITVDDKIALVKNCFAPLLVFTFAVRTAEVTDDPNVLCMCTFSFVPRDMAKAYTDSYHLSNGLVERALDELVTPLRNLKLKQEEIVCLKATLVLNPHAKDLSPEGSQKIIECRSRIQDTLYHVIKETRSKEHASVQFGNLLLFLPNVTLIANCMSENLQFAQTFSPFGGIPLLTNLFGCFPVEPFSDIPPEKSDDDSMDLDEEGTDVDIPTKEPSSFADAAVQTDPVRIGDQTRKRRRMGPSLLSPVENPENRDFKLLQAPCVYTLTEMFDDANTDTRDQFVAEMKDQKALLEHSMACTDSSLYAQEPTNGSEASLPLQSSRSSCSGNIFDSGASLHRRRMPNEKRSPQSAALASRGINKFFLPMSSLDFPTPPATATTESEPRSSSVPFLFSQQVNELDACSVPDSFIYNMLVPTSQNRHDAMPYVTTFRDANLLKVSQADADTRSSTSVIYGAQPCFTLSSSFDKLMHHDSNIFSTNNIRNLSSERASGL